MAGGSVEIQGQQQSILTVWLCLDGFVVEPNRLPKSLPFKVIVAVLLEVDSLFVGRSREGQGPQSFQSRIRAFCTTLLLFDLRKIRHE